MEKRVIDLESIRVKIKNSLFFYNIIIDKDNQQIEEDNEIICN